MKLAWNARLSGIFKTAQHSGSELFRSGITERLQFSQSGRVNVSRNKNCLEQLTDLNIILIVCICSVWKYTSQSTHAHCTMHTEFTNNDKGRAAFDSTFKYLYLRILRLNSILAQSLLQRWKGCQETPRRSHRQHHHQMYNHTTFLNLTLTLALILNPNVPYGTWSDHIFGANAVNVDSVMCFLTLEMDRVPSPQPQQSHTTVQRKFICFSVQHTPGTCRICCRKFEWQCMHSQLMSIYIFHTTVYLSKRNHLQPTTHLVRW